MKFTTYSYQLTLAASHRQKEKRYWENKLGGNPVKSIFNYDKKKIDGTEPQYDSCDFSITGDLLSKIKNLSKEIDYTLFIIFYAAISHILYRYSANTNPDILIGTTIFKKNTETGLINSILALRNAIDESKGIKDLLMQSRQTVVDAIENQNYPFPVLIDQLKIDVPEDEYPLFEVVLILENIQSRDFLKDIPYRILFAFNRNEDSIGCSLIYDNRFYHETTIRLIFDHFIYWLESITRNIDQKLSEISIITPEEKENLLYSFNHLQTDCPKDMTIDRLFEEQVRKNPDHIALISPFTDNSSQLKEGVVYGQFSYSKLNEKANLLAHTLKEKGIVSSKIIAIIIEPSLEMIIGLLGIIKSGSAYIPISPEWPSDRVDYILKDSAASIIIDEKFIHEAIQNSMEKPSHTSKSNPEDLCYVIYTSGSTGKPKGVMVEHRNLVANIFAFYHQFSITSHDTVIHLSDYTFDAFAEELYPIMLKGGKMAIPDPGKYLDIPLLGEFINRYDVDIIDCSPLLLNELNKLPFLKSIRIIISGGDVLRDKYITHLSKIGNVYNTYGPTETTICAAYYPYNPTLDNSSRISIPIGKPIANYKIFILDDSLSLVPIGVVGEICISGPGVTRGYLNRCELTAERFVFSTPELLELTHINTANTFINTFYKTGDLGRWLVDGNIEYTGRKDFQVKIRGFRIETGEIETLLLNSGIVQDVVVDARTGKDGEKNLCAYYIEDSKISEKSSNSSHQLKNYLQEKLPTYMIPAFFMKLDKFPLSSSGKVNRKALPEPVINVSVEFIEPRNDIERRIAKIWKEVFEIERIGINDNFFELGGHSLLGVQVINGIQQEFNIKLAFTEVFIHPTVRQLAILVSSMENQSRQSIEISEEKEFYNTSSAQKRLYILHQMAPDTTVYNMPYVFPMDSNYDKEKIEEVFKQLIARHDSLRTFFQMVDNEPVQRIDRKNNFSIEHHLIDSSRIKEYMARFIKPFDLSIAPLLRVEIMDIGSGASIRRFLLLDMHHIITDGVSQAIFHREFISLLNREELPPIEVQYKDYSEWQYTEVTKEKLKQQKQYWLSQFPNEPPVLNLPIDYPRPVVQSFEGKTIWFELEREEAQRFKQFAREANTTTYILAFAVFYILLSKLSGQEDILIGTPVAGRSYPELESIIGMFVNTIVLRNNPSHALPFNEFLEDVKKHALDAFQNQDFPFEELVESVMVKRDMGRNPLFDVMFALQNEKEQEEKKNESSDTDIQFSDKVSRFDITWLAVESPDGLRFMLEYCSRLFNEGTIKRFIAYYKQIISQILENNSELLSQIEIITLPEKEQILYDFNRDYSYENSITIHGLFARQVERTPDNPALVTEDARLTYKELESLAHQVAYGLNLKGIQPGDLVAIKMNRSIEMIATILGILKAGCAYVPMNPKNPEERTRFMMVDSGAKLLIKSLKELTEDIENNKSLVERLHPTQDHASAIQNNSLAYVIYTSGSTGNPKGVPISHANLCPLLHWGFRHMALNSNDRTLQNLSYFFDWSVWEIFITLTSGASLYIANEETLLIPEEMRTYIKKNQITVLHITPTQYQGLINAAAPGMENELLLGTLKHLCIGAEKLTYEVVKRSYSLVSEDCHIYNMYGPTEATIMAAVLEIDRSKGHDYENLGSIPIGLPISNNVLFIFDKYMRLCTVKVVGELYIGGEGIARGYLNNPELTADKFVYSAHELHELTRNTNTITNTFYKTGDLCRWIEDGTIEYIGRIDFQVKIRGLRIELGEIENNLLTHSNIKSAVVIVKGGDRLCAYIVLNERPSEFNTTWKEEIKEFLSMRLPQYMVPSNIIEIESIPLNPNGKVDLKALPEPEDMDEGRQYTAPGTEMEKQMVSIWSSVLGIQESRIGIDDNFFELGGHSLKGTILISKIYSVLNVKLTLAQLFTAPTVRQLALEVQHITPIDYSSIPKAEVKDYYIMSSAQMRMYILSKMEAGSIQYNLPALFELGKNVDPKRIENVFRLLIDRHESFRSSFHLLDTTPVQQVHARVPFSMNQEEVENQNELQHKIHQFVRVFDLTIPPLFRACVFNMKDGRRYLIIDMHHIISDGTSMEIFRKEFLTLYRNDFSIEALPSLPVQYKDYAQWQVSNSEKVRAEQQKRYWMKRFEGEIPVLDLPLDYPRPPVQSFEGSSISFVIDHDQTAKLHKFALETNSTLFMVCIGLFHILLSQLSRQDDIIIGTPVAGRRHPELANIIGMFINTLALRNISNDSLSFIDFINTIKTSTLDAFENQEYPFEDILEEIKVQRNSARNPLFDVMFALQNMESTAFVDKGEVEIKPVSYESNVAKFDITLGAYELNNELHFTFEYCTRLFKEETIRRFIEYFKNIVASVSRDPRISIGQIEIITSTEKEQILYSFNSPHQYPNDRLAHELFMDQAEKYPDHIALVSTVGSIFQQQQITYSELHTQSNRMMLWLQHEGIVPGDLVAIKMDRSADMIISILGILKAGCAYVPINPKNPEERVEFLMKDSRAKLLITSLTELTQDMENKNLLGKSHPPKVHEPVFQKNSLAYVIYTSGSTGNPKGVPISHSNLCPLLHWGYSYVPLNQHDRTLQNLSFFFDWSVWEIFITITSGATLCITTEEVLLTPVDTIAFMNKYHITALHITPTQYQALIGVNSESIKYKPLLGTLKYLCIGAEKLPYETVKRSYPLVKEDCRIYNMYGPTEATIMAAVLDISKDKSAFYESLGSVPIGLPIANNPLLVLDRNNKLCPIRVVGELYIGGDGIARGYLNNPQLTAERFYDFQGLVLRNPPLDPDKTSDINKLLDESIHSQLTKSFKGVQGGVVHKAPMHKSQQNKTIYYKTGDLCRWLEDGSIEYIGRIDFQVKIRGYRIELGEIEDRILKSPFVKEAVVVQKTDSAGDKYLCGYVVSKADSPLDTQELKEFISQGLPAYMVPSHIIKIERMPLNPNGKVDLKALPEPGDIKQERQFTSPRTPLEKQLVSIWSSVLGIQEERIGIDDDFFELGGHSLKGTIFVSRVYSILNIKLTLPQIFISPTIRELAVVIEKMDREAYVSIPKAQEQEYYVMSPAQIRLYILGKIDPGSTQYNLPALFELGEEVDIVRIEKIFSIMIQRHESFRTSFHTHNDRTFQQIHHSVSFSLTHEEAESEEQLKSGIKRFIRPFDLTTPPLFRACVFHLNDSRRYLIIDMHHIISDGTSMEIFKKEFITLYRDNLSTHSLIPITISYKDYSQWLEGVQEQERAKRQKEYWLKQFNGELPVLNLPLDYIRPVIQSFEGTTIPFKLEIPQTQQLNRIAIENNATLFMVCFSLFHILLSRLSRQDDIIIGTPVAGRRHPELANIIGMFINTLALRNVSDESLTFIEFLNRIKTSTLNAFENQEYPFEDILDAVKVQRDTARNPLFDVMFALQNMEAAVNNPDSSVEIKPVSFESNIAKFDITLIAYENRGELNLVFEYCTRLFKEESIKRFIQYFKNITACITQNPRIPISRIDIITSQEREQILFQFNRQEEAPNTSYKTLTCLFQEQVERTPDHIALSEIPIQLTFRQLDEEARRFSLYLNKKGIRPRDLVAISIHRSIQMIIGVLGILKAGCTYVPINPKNPENRIKYLMEDSGSRLLVDARSFEEANQLRKEGALIGDELPSSSVDDFAYVLYTSGSTGNPKGVPITHANLFPLLYWGQTNLRFIYTDRTIQTPSFFFDWSVWEIFLTLSSGASLYMINDDILLNPANMIQFIYKHHITILHVTPTQCRYLVDLKHPLTPLRYLIMGGEKLTLTLVRELFELVNSKCRVFNQYGATEATIISTAIELDRNNYLKYNTLSGISIGWTITGTTLYIFDRSMNLCPVNVPGELYIGGEGIARGYLNNPELTAERFIFSSHQLHEFTRTTTTNTSTNTLYKTGDLVKWLEDGQIEFLGRIDFQVKIRGYRIETGEIENFLMGYKNIKDVVVVALDDEVNREKFLCAYIVSYEGEISIKELREHLGKNMPQYMIPQAFVQLEYIPWNPNGKADLKQLPRPQLKAKEGFIPPSNEVEEKMIEIWASVLGLEKEAISMDDNFFIIGGHSLKATILLNKIHQVFDIEIALAEIFKNPTPHELCTFITLTKWEFKPGESEDTEFEEILL